MEEFIKMVAAMRRAQKDLKKRGGGLNVPGSAVGSNGL